MRNMTIRLSLIIHTHLLSSAQFQKVRKLFTISKFYCVSFILKIGHCKIVTTKDLNSIRLNCPKKISNQDLGKK